jgi:hypothetical protein
MPPSDTAPERPSGLGYNTEWLQEDSGYSRTNARGTSAAYRWGNIETSPNGIAIWAAMAFSTGCAESGVYTFQV